MVTSLLLAVLMCFLGAMTWSFSEYALHNWVGHLGRGKNHFSREHLHHHSKGDYFAPAWQKLVASIAVVGPMGVVSVFLMGKLFGLSYTLGFSVMYFLYEWLHRRLHSQPPRGFYGRWARRHHFYHHFVNPKMNHGVTSPIWDIVFGTYVEPEQIRVPEKLAMEWLCDPQSGDVHTSFAHDYVLRRRKSVA